MLNTRRFSLEISEKRLFYTQILRGYFRNAQGNVLAIYQKKDNNFTWKEQHLYGSSRLGIFSPEVKIQGVYVLDVAALKQSVRSYELTNHLGNVLSTLTDKGVITSAQDYFPFGLTLASRSFTEGGSVYRYSFNGKEDDKGTKLADFENRMYRKDLAKWLSVDPLSDKMPEWSAYNFGFDNPIQYNDPDGREPKTGGDPEAKVGVTIGLSNKGRLNFRANLSVGVSMPLEASGQLNVSINANTYNSGVGTSSSSSVRASMLGFDFSTGAAITVGKGKDEKNTLPIYVGNATSLTTSTNPFRYSVTYGKLLIFSTGLKDFDERDKKGGWQHNGLIGVRIDNFSASHQNDLFGDKGDRGFTGGVNVSAKIGDNLLEIGNDIYTGTPRSSERNGKSTIGIGYGLRNFTQSEASRSLNNGMTFIRVSNAQGVGVQLYSQGQGNLWFQRGMHMFGTKNPVFREDKTPNTEFGASFYYNLIKR